MTVSVETAAPAEPLRKKPWGVLASIIWVLVTFEVLNRAFDTLFAFAPLHEFEQGSRVLHALNLAVVWGTELLVIVVAVRLVRWPVAEYLGWIRPRVKDVAFGIAIVLAWNLALTSMAYLTVGSAFDVAGYRAAVAAGMSPWWYVLRWWPTFICSPIVEESAIRGFLWRGVENRAGRVAAFVLTSLVFAAIHYRYFVDHGQIYLGTLGTYIVGACIYGWVRWRSGGTTAPIIAHAFDNLYIALMPVIASVFVA